MSLGTVALFQQSFSRPGHGPKGCHEQKRSWMLCLSKASWESRRGEVHKIAQSANYYNSPEIPMFLLL